MHLPTILLAVWASIAATSPALNRRVLSGKPSGADTSGVARPLSGSSAAWPPSFIYTCARKGDIALTFDDGPMYWTGQLLDKLNANSMKATFFLNGDNYGRGYINDPNTPWPAILRRMDNEGHQVASHTWDHASLNSLSQSQVRDEMIWNEIAIADVLGKFPTYMRPPYGECNSQCSSVMQGLGYHVVMWNLDTMGYSLNFGNSRAIWDNAVSGANPASTSFINLEHDPVQGVVTELVDHFIRSIKSKGFRAVTVGECMGDSKASWYRSTSGGGSSGGGSGTTIISKDGTCGNGVTCQDSGHGNCCSQYGWCGSTAPYCSAGCQSGLGTCW